MGGRIADAQHSIEVLVPALLRQLLPRAYPRVDGDAVSLSESQGALDHAGALWNGLQRPPTAWRTVMHRDGIVEN
jgi:hypothetical protein